MKKVLFILVYVVSLAVPGILYGAVFGCYLDSYTLSFLAGTAAYMMLCNQILLAPRPRWAVSWTSTAFLLNFHRITGGIILLLIVLHRALKIMAGFDPAAPQSLLGSLSLLFMVVFILVAIIFLGRRSRFLSSFRKKIDALGFPYRRRRFFHSLVTLLILPLVVHILWASSGNWGVNPAGSLFLVLWTILSLEEGIRLKVHRRKV